MSAKIKDLFPSTSWSIQLLPRQRRGAAGTKWKYNFWCCVPTGFGTNNILKPCSDRKSRQGIPGTFSVDLDEREYDRYHIQCSAVWCRYQGCSGWVVGHIVRCHNAGPGDLETSSCRLPSEPLSIVLTSNISYVFMDRGSSGTSWVLSCECFTLDMVTASKKYLHRYRILKSKLILNLFPGNSFTVTAKIL